jgi:hypothetical protein
MNPQNPTYQLTEEELKKIFPMYELYPNSRFSAFNPYYAVNYDEQTNSLFLTDNMGYIYSREVMRIIAEGLLRFINCYPDSEIDRYNMVLKIKREAERKRRENTQHKGPNKFGTVYVVRDNTTGLFRFGYTRQKDTEKAIKARIKSLKNTLPEPSDIELVYTSHVDDCFKRLEWIHN